MSEMKIVAEAGACDGSLDYALQAAHMASAAGVWGFKVQMYQADLIATTWAQRYDHLPSGHKGQHDAFSNALPYGEWQPVKDMCDDLGVEFFASCFDTLAVDQCEEMEVNYYKVASGEITNLPLLRYIGETGKDVILSTGASTVAEIDQAITALDFAHPDEHVTLLACSLEYPASTAAMHRITQLQMIFGDFSVGYSDHTLGTASTWVATALGATMLEKHFTITPGEGGDHDMGVTPTELHEMNLIANRAEDLLWTPFEFGPMPEEQEARKGARRGVYYSHDMSEGEPFGPESVVMLRPCNVDVTPADAEKLYGGRMTKGVREGEQFVPDNVDAS